MFRLCFLLFVCLVSPIIATTVSKCKGSDVPPLPSDVEVAGCSAQPCNFVRGQETVMDLTFESPRLITLFKPLAAAWALGLHVDYPLNVDDGCDALVNSECPLDEGDVATYHFTFEVLRAFPLVDLSIEFTLVDQDNLPIVCFNITGRTADP